jgi:hypothetical protein
MVTRGDVPQPDAIINRASMRNMKMFCLIGINFFLYRRSHPTRLSKSGLWRAIPLEALIEGPVSGVAGGFTGVLLRQGSVDHPKGVDLADIVDEGE